MNEQRVEPQVRLVNAIDRDLIDAKINLNLIERLTEQNDHPQTRAFNDEELQAIYNKLHLCCSSKPHQNVREA